MLLLFAREKHPNNNENSFRRSRSHIQRCNGETDPTAALISNQPEDDGCSLESGDIDETESVQLETVSSVTRRFAEKKRKEKKHTCILADNKDRSRLTPRTFFTFRYFNR